jgi:hypothetical protein
MYKSELGRTLASQLVLTSPVKCSYSHEFVGVLGRVIEIERNVTKLLHGAECFLDINYLLM